MRSLSDVLKAKLAQASLPHLWMLVYFPTVYQVDGVTPLRFTNYTRRLTWGGATWLPLAGIDGKNFGETIDLEAPAATLRLPSMDASFQELSLADGWRGQKCWITIICQDPGTLLENADQIWQTRYTVGPDNFDEDGVTLTLESADAAEGSDVPKRQVSDVGCQHQYMRGLCPYRGHMVYSLNSTTRAPYATNRFVFNSCSKRIEDADGKPGCSSHFPAPTVDSANLNVAGTLNPEWSTTAAATVPRWLRMPLPYGAYPGGNPTALVL